MSRHSTHFDTSFDMGLYHMAGKFGEEFNSVVWRIMNAQPNYIPPIFCHDVRVDGLSHTTLELLRTHSYYSTCTSVSDLPEIASKQLTWLTMVFHRITATAYWFSSLPLAWQFLSHTRIPEVLADVVPQTQLSTANSDSIAAYRHKTSCKPPSAPWPRGRVVSMMSFSLC